MSSSKDPAISVGGNTTAGQSPAARADESAHTNALGVAAIWEDVKQKASDFVDDLGEGFNAATTRATATVQDNVNATEDHVDHLMDSTKESTVHTWDATKQNAAEIKQNAAETGKSTLNSAEQKVDDAWDSTKQTASNVKHESQGFVNSTSRKTEDLFHGATNKAEQGANAVRESSVGDRKDKAPDENENVYAISDKVVVAPVDTFNATVNSMGEKVMRKVFTPETPGD